MTDSTVLRDALPAQAPRGRLLITLVVDTSESMRESGRIDELNAALRGWREELLKVDPVASIGEIAMVTFGFNHVQVIDPSGRVSGPPAQPYVPVREFSPPELRADGVTPLVAGVQEALRLVAVRRRELREAGMPMKNRPLVYLITDGVPTDDKGHKSNDWQDLAPVIRQQESGKHILFFAFGVTGADEAVLRALAPESYSSLTDVTMARVLSLMSASIESAGNASRDQPAEKVYKDAREHQKQADRIREWMRRNG